MPLEESVGADAFAQVPEQFKDWYRQEGDKYVLDVVPRKINNGTLEAKRKAEQEAAKLRATQSDPDLEEAKALLLEKRAKEAEETAKSPSAEAQLQRERQKLKAAYEKDRAELEQKLTASTEREARYLRDDAVTKAALDAGVQAEFLDDVRLHAKESLRVVDGELVDKDGDKVKPAAWLKDLISKRKGWLGASVGGGTVKGGGAGGAPQAGKFQRSKMSIQEMAAYQKEHGLEAYKKLPY